MFKERFSERSKYYSACKECNMRSEGCRSGCEEYAKEVILGAILEADAKKENARREDNYKYHESKALRIANASPSAKRAMQKNRLIQCRGGR